MRMLRYRLADGRVLDELVDRMPEGSTDAEIMAGAYTVLMPHGPRGPMVPAFRLTDRYGASHMIFTHALSSISVEEAPPEPFFPTD